MQSAFVDLGLERDAFLYVTDVFEELDENLLTPEETGRAAANGGHRSSPIEERLHEGQEVLVQVVKEPLGHEGRAHHLPRLAARAATSSTCRPSSTSGSRARSPTTRSGAG